MLGVLLALSATSIGWLVARELGLRTSNLARCVAPAVGLASMVVVCSWCAALGMPPSVMSGLVGLGALGGAALAISRARSLRRPGWPAVILLVAVVLPAVLLAAAFAGLEVPVSNHDGAYHVETIDALRRGARVETWYPHGYHLVVAAVLGFFPWLDTARGVLDTSQGLSVLVPIGVFGLARSARFSSLTAAIAALILAVTSVYPYNLHLWGGWPLGTSMVLVVGLWTVAVRWTEQPKLVWALLGGLFSGAILLTHGTEVYTAALGLAVLALARLRRLQIGAVVRHVSLAAGLAIGLAGPYVSVLLGWARAGGASSAGLANLEGPSLASAAPSLWADPSSILPALVGAGSVFETGLRLGLLLLGAAALLRARAERWLLGLWLVFAALLLIFDAPSLPAVSRIYVATYPWADGHRLGQLVTILGSVLAARGAVAVIDRWSALRQRFLAHPVAWRRLTVAACVLAAFLVEGSAVSVYKYMAELSQRDATYAADDQLAMAWLRENARPGETLANDFWADAGIWAPYKADLPILLPRSAEDTSGRQFLESHLADLGADPDLAAKACALRVGYVYAGAKANTYDHPPLDLTALEQSPALEEVFRSGDAAVFRTRLACDA